MRTLILAALAAFAALLGATLAVPDGALAVSSTLVINEVDYDQVGSDTAEFIELKNVSGSPISLSGYSLEFIQGAASGHGTAYRTVALPAGDSVASGDYYVVCANAATVANCDYDDPAGNTDWIQNGDPDGLRLVLGGTVIDALSYEGTTANSTEGNPVPAGSGDSNSVAGSLQRCPDGVDTDDNATDFSFRETITPGAASSCAAGTTVSVTATDGSASENGDTGTFTFTRTGDASGALEVSYAVSGSASSADYDAEPPLDGTLTFAEGVSSVPVVVTPADDVEIEGPETLIVTITEGDYDIGAASATITITDNDVPVCLAVTHTIGAVQGSDATTPLNGQTVTVKGVVTGDFEGGTPGFSGFTLQNLPGEADGDPDTSDGIFVFNGAAANQVSVGQVVQVTGTAGEFNSLTQIGGTPTIEDCGTTGSVDPVDIQLPQTAAGFERYESMLVRFPQQLTIAEYFNYDRFGEIVLALPLEGEPLPFTATALEVPGAAALARTAANLERRITLDDGRNDQNPALLRHPNGQPFSLENRFRGGDLVASTTGVLDYRFNLFRVQPTAPATYTAANPRPETPAAVGGSVRVAAFNTLNYFLTLDPDGGPGDNACGPSANLECRGADTADELTRQRAKLLQALIGIDGDIVGLNEIENTTGVEPLADIVAGLNDVLGEGTYDFIDTGTIGTDAIRVGIIYRPGIVTPVGDYEILTSGDDPRFRDNLNRPVLAQTFEEIETGERFTVAVVHLKSKGSDCNAVGDPDAGDGQGNCSGTRTLAAQALVDWLASDPTDSGDPDFLIIGDMNSYAMEDPIAAVLAGPDDTTGTDDDYVNLVLRDLGPFARSYVFDGQFGYLDHALASATLATQVTGTTEWHINADEPDILDYDNTFKPPAQAALYEVNAFRTSDHDPVIVGLALGGGSEAGATVEVVFDAATVATGQTVTAQVLVSTEAALAGIDFTFAFDPAKLQVAGITPGTGWSTINCAPESEPEECLVIIDNTNGSLTGRYFRLAPNGPVSGADLVIVTVSFNAIGASEGTALDLTAGVLSTPNGVAIEPVELVDSGTLEIEEGQWTISGTVLLQGRTDHSGTVVHYGGESVTTTASGAFVLQVATGTSGTLVAVHPGYLRAVSVSFMVEGNVAAEEIVLRGGDATGDGKIDIFDLALIAGHYGTSGPWNLGNGPLEPVQAITPDINGTGGVNLFDLTITAGNYGLLVPSAWALVQP